MQQTCFREISVTYRFMRITYISIPMRDAVSHKCLTNISSIRCSIPGRKTSATCNHYRTLISLSISITPLNFWRSSCRRMNSSRPISIKVSIGRLPFILDWITVRHRARPVNLWGGRSMNLPICRTSTRLDP